MGLDTSHDCWHGPYSAFMRWRCHLHQLLHPYQTGKPYDNLIAAWEAGEYDDQSVPINILMLHSDCDGEIAWQDCAGIADALEELLERMPERALYDMYRGATERFIDGLRLASEKQEDVLFR